MPDLLLFKFVGVPLFIVFFLIENIIYYKRNNKPNLIYRLIFYSFFIYLLFVLKLTFFPLPIGEDAIMDYQIMALQNNFVPFKEIIGYSGFAYYPMIGNIALLFPLGIYLPILFKRKGFGSVLIVGLITTVSIESMQFIISSIVGVTYRTTDINDVIFNTLGLIMGYIVFKLINPILIPLLQGSKVKS